MSLKNHVLISHHNTNEDTTNTAKKCATVLIFLAQLTHCVPLNFCNVS